MTVQDDGVLVLQLPRGPREDAEREQLQLRVRTYNGRPFVDARIRYRGESGDYLPTRKGVTIRIHEVQEVRAALDKALDLIAQGETG